MIKAARFLTSTVLIVGIVSFLNAETVNLNGTVRNSWNRPVASARVSLSGDSTITTATDSAGRFMLNGQITSVVRPAVRGRAPSVILRGRYIRVLLTESSPITVNYYNTAGRRVFNSMTGMLDPGPTVLMLPRGGLAANFSIIEVGCEGTRHLFRYAAMGGRKSFSLEGGMLSDALFVTRKAVASSGSPIDTLSVSALGYLTTKYPLSSYDQSGIEIQLQHISRLENITRSCDGVTIIPVSGGQKGWGSRYWDCCKPSCSWPENTKHIAANCGIDGIKEIECFKEVGNEFSTWLEGTRSGCETQDGIAYMCYRHTPFAVCEKLAYGFAAVPAANSACGKCFQLDFDGGFRHGDPKPAHAMIKGKTMIVMASNIGHDVGSGQFDIMIPGGGLGNCREGCRKQWGVDVNDENIVGKGLGGFISKCQDNLGWDADPEDLKECVRGMCDNLFGDDPARRDLWEGCIWYVDWMHAVDNPTFTYKEVPCPRELIDLYYSSMHPKP